MQAAQAMVSEAIELVSLPDVYWRVKRLVDSAQSSAQEIAREISTDPALSARLLRLANSAIWGFGGKITSISHAAMLLGTRQVHDMVLATSVSRTFAAIRPEQMDLGRFWRVSALRALAAASLARRAGLRDAERLFVEGLLSDLGHMILYQRVPELAARALQMAGGRADELPRVERTLIGCDYAQVGGALIDAWNLPECFQIAVQFQEEPEAAEIHTFEAALVHIAGRLAAQDPSCVGADAAAENPAAVCDFVWQITGLNQGCLPEVIEEVRASLPSACALLTPGTKGRGALKAVA